MAREAMQQQFDRFTKDVAGHSMNVLSDDGLRRHLRFSNRGSFNMAFDLVTWPGYLCYTGDMGCYVFQRIEDMFQFFRGKDGPFVDFRYLSEKCEAADKHDGISEFSAARFESIVRERADEFAEGLADEEREHFESELRDEVLCYDEEHESIRAASDFQFNGRLVFPDFWEHRFTEYTGRFVWCAYAIAWGIGQYDQAKRQQATEVA